MPADLTEITEITTALGMLGLTLDDALASRPLELVNVEDPAWERLSQARLSGQHTTAFSTAFSNGSAFLAAAEGLRGRLPRRVEWKGPHRPPGDDPIPADLRVDHVNLISCKYLSKVLLNPGPRRLFDRLLVEDERSKINWFVETAPAEFQAFFTSATYFVLGTDHAAHLRFRIDSAWDWSQSYELRRFDVSPRTAGQPEVGWRAVVRSRSDRDEQVVDGHVEVRWSHGRFLGNPESKVYLDNPHARVPGYHQLA